MGIIHKNRKNIQNYLLFQYNWCIVTMRLFSRAVFCAFFFTHAASHQLMSFNDWMCVMGSREPLYFLHKHRRRFIFCVVYLLGLIAGASCTAQYSVSTLMLSLVYPRMSIVIGCLVSALPFFVYHIVFRCLAFYWILPVTFAKAFGFMYCFAGVSLAYADAGWLVCFLVLFSDCFLTPLLLWYGVSRLSNEAKGRDRSIWFCLLCVLVIRCIDSYMVSPFALELLSF